MTQKAPKNPTLNAQLTALKKKFHATLDNYPTSKTQTFATIASGEFGGGSNIAKQIQQNYNQGQQTSLKTYATDWVAQWRQKNNKQKESELSFNASSVDDGISASSGKSMKIEAAYSSKPLQEIAAYFKQKAQVSDPYKKSLKLNPLSTQKQQIKIPDKFKHLAAVANFYKANQSKPPVSAVKMLNADIQKPKSILWNMIPGATYNADAKQWVSDAVKPKTQKSLKQKRQKSEKTAALQGSYARQLQQVGRFINQADLKLRTMGYQSLGPLSDKGDTIAAYLGRYINPHTGRLKLFSKPKYVYNKRDYDQVYAYSILSIGYRWNQLLKQIDSFHNNVLLVGKKNFAAAYDAKHRNVGVQARRRQQFKSAVKLMIVNKFRPFKAATGAQKKAMVAAIKAWDYEAFADLVTAIATTSYTAAKTDGQKFIWSRYKKWRDGPNKAADAHAKMIALTGPTTQEKFKSTLSDAAAKAIKGALPWKTTKIGSRVIKKTTQLAKKIAEAKEGQNIQIPAKERLAGYGLYDEIKEYQQNLELLADKSDVQDTQSVRSGRQSDYNVGQDQLQHLKQWVPVA